MTIYLIAAQSENGVIGQNGKIPWYAKGEQRLFRDLTLGHTLVMGRKTAESINRPLPERDTIVVSRQVNFRMQGCYLARSPDKAIELAARLRGDTFISGGGEIYEQLLEVAQGVHLTTIRKRVEGGDSYFPPFPQDEFLLEKERTYKTNVSYTYRYYRRLDPNNCLRDQTCHSTIALPDKSA